MSPSHTFCAGCGQHLELSYTHGVEHWTALAAENEAARMVATKESFIFVSVEQKVFHCGDQQRNLAITWPEMGRVAVKTNTWWKYL